MACFDCDEGPCHMNCGPWRASGERYIGKTAEHIVTEDGNGYFRVHHPRTNTCLSLHGTPVKAFQEAEHADAVAIRGRKAVFG